MNLILTILFLLKSELALLSPPDILCDHALLINASDEYVLLRYTAPKTLIITNPCDTRRSIAVVNHSLYQFDAERVQWKRLCTARKLLAEQTPAVSAVAHLKNDLILLIHKTLFRAQELISSANSKDAFYQLSRYHDIPILSPKVDYVFTTPCCTCLANTTVRTTSQAFNDYVVLANTNGNAILFSFQSMSTVYDFGSIFQSQPLCQANNCTILHLGLLHAVPVLICVVQSTSKKVVIYHQSFLEYSSALRNSTLIDFTGDTLYITPTTFPNAYFLWDARKIHYTPNGGLTFSEVTVNGCQSDAWTNMDENQLKKYYADLGIDYDSMTLSTKALFCFNRTIEYILISNQEFYMRADNNTWYYGKESILPSMMKLPSKAECDPILHDRQNLSLPYLTFNISRCWTNIDSQTIPCSPFVLSSCFSVRFEPLFDARRIYILEKNSQQEFRFILEAYTVVPVIIVSTESEFFDYAVNYTIDRVYNGIIRMTGNMVVATTNQTSDRYGSSLTSFRLALVQHGYSCSHAPSFSFQIEASCSAASALRVEKGDESDLENLSNPTVDVDWIQQHIAANTLRHSSPIYIKRKQSEAIALKYQYCLNDTCQSIDNHDLDSLLIYAIPFKKEHEDYAHYLINRSDGCMPLSRSIYRLWVQWTLNMTGKTQPFQIPYERRTFYRTLLQTSSVSNQSCLFFNGSAPIHINETVNQASPDHLKFLVHIIAYNNRFSYCDLQTLLVLEVETTRPAQITYRGFPFLVTLCLVILSLLLLLRLFTYYKQRQRQTYLAYHRLNQIDAGQLHQWYDIARYLNENKNTNHYHLTHAYLRNLQPSSNVTERLMEHHGK